MQTQTILVRVSDTITFERTAVLLVEVPNGVDAGVAERIALDRAEAGELAWTETQTDNTPYESRAVLTDGAWELADLLKADRDRVGPLDADERSAMESLRRELKVEDDEIGRFNAARPAVSRPASDRQPSASSR